VPFLLLEAEVRFCPFARGRGTFLSGRRLCLRSLVASWFSSFSRVY